MVAFMLALMHETLVIPNSSNIHSLATYSSIGKFPLAIKQCAVYQLPLHTSPRTPEGLELLKVMLVCAKK
jgi:hypothetical protein